MHKIHMPPSGSVRVNQASNLASKNHKQCSVHYTTIVGSKRTQDYAAQTFEVLHVRIYPRNG